MIHAVASIGEPICYVISSRGYWRPGSYDNARTARYAFQFLDEDLRALQDSLNPNGVITHAHLRELRRTLREKRAD